MRGMNTSRRKLYLALALPTLIIFYLFLLFVTRHSMLGILMPLPLVALDRGAHYVLHLGRMPTSDSEIVDAGRPCYSGFQCISGSCKIFHNATIPNQAPYKYWLGDFFARGVCDYGGLGIGCSSNVSFGMSTSGVCVD